MWILSDIQSNIHLTKINVINDGIRREHEFYLILTLKCE